MHNAREGSARNELYLYLVHRYEYRGTICRPGPHRLCGRRKVYRSVDVGFLCCAAGFCAPGVNWGRPEELWGGKEKQSDGKLH